MMESRVVEVLLFKESTSQRRGGKTNKSLDLGLWYCDKVTSGDVVM